MSLAPKKFGRSIDLNSNQIKNAVVDKLSSAPGSPVEGQIYYDSVTKILYFYNNSSWVSTSGVALPVSIANGGTGATTVSGALLNLGIGSQIIKSYNLNPTGGAQTNKMMGLAVQITLAVSTKIFVIIEGDQTNTVASNITTNLRYGTGTPPTNGATAIGTTEGTPSIYTGSSASGKTRLSHIYIITGLTVGQTYWIDLEYTAAVAAALLSKIDVTIREI